MKPCHRNCFIYFMYFVLMCFCGMHAEETDPKYSIGPLPPMNLSLNAPVQIDENNIATQERFTQETPERLEYLLKVKRFPIEIVLLAFLGGIAVFIAKNWRPTVEEVVVPPITPEERIQQAQQLLMQATEHLSDEEALSLFSLLDPIAETFPEKEDYYALSEQVKFAGHPLKKSEFIGSISRFDQVI